MRALVLQVVTVYAVKWPRRESEQILDSHEFGQVLPVEAFSTLEYMRADFAIFLVVSKSYAT